MRKILFITKSYPNFRGSATVLCTHRIMEACALCSDFEVHCLCMRYDEDAYEDFVKNIHVHRYSRTYWKQFYDKCSINRMFQHKMEQAQKFVMLPIFPCINPFIMYRGYKCAKNLYLKEHFDVVVAEHNVHENIRIGLLLKQHYPILKFYPVLWDPILGCTLSPILPQSFIKRRILEFEDKVNALADNIFSIQAAKSIYSKYRDSSNGKRIYIDIPSILPPEQEVSTKHLSLLKDGYINIVFSGLVGSPFRDPNPIIEMLNNSKYAKKINLLFFCKGFSETNKSYWQKNFLGNIIVHEYIPLCELHTIYRHADYLLNISHTNADMTPSKIFEYMSYGKPIISIYVTDGDSAAKYLDKYPEACIVDQKEEVQKNTCMIESFLEKKHSDISFDVVERLFSYNTPQKFVETIKKLTIQK